jgi:hypothetical protein
MYFRIQYEGGQSSSIAQTMIPVWIDVKAFSNHTSETSEGAIPVNVTLQICRGDGGGDCIEGVFEVSPADRRHITGLHAA